MHIKAPTWIKLTILKMIKFATCLLVTATAVTVRETETGDAAWDDAVYNSGLEAGRAAAREYLATHQG